MKKFKWFCHSERSRGIFFSRIVTRSLVAPLLGMTVGVFLLFNLNNVIAQVTLPLTVAPARQELTVNPGEATAVNIRFYNLSDAPVSGLLKTGDFIVEDKEGTPRIVESVDQTQPRFSASTWLTLPYDRITIAANEKVAIQTKIQVPFNARPGGRYVAVYFEPAAGLPANVGGEKEVGSSIAPRIAALIYMRVSGPITESALLTRFFAKNFYEYGPINIETEILNRSDYHVRPRGIVSITNMFGGLLAQEKIKEQNIFPDTTRSFKNQLGEKWMFGRYRIDLAAAYGEKGQALTRFIYVWAFPWRVAVVLILTAITMFVLIKHFFDSLSQKESLLEKEVKEEHEEIEKLKEQLKKRE